VAPPHHHLFVVARRCPHLPTPPHRQAVLGVTRLFYPSTRRVTSPLDQCPPGFRVPTFPPLNDPTPRARRRPTGGHLGQRGIPRGTNHGGRAPYLDWTVDGSGRTDVEPGPYPRRRGDDPTPPFGTRTAVRSPFTDVVHSAMTGAQWWRTVARRATPPPVAYGGCLQLFPPQALVAV